MEHDIIQYVVRYRVCGIWGIHSLPIFIPIDANPVKYVKNALDAVYPAGYDIVDLKLPIAEIISDEQFKLNRKYIDRISEILQGV